MPGTGIGPSRTALASSLLLHVASIAGLWMVVAPWPRPGAARVAWLSVLRPEVPPPLPLPDEEPLPPARAEADVVFEPEPPPEPSESFDFEAPGALPEPAEAPLRPEATLDDWSLRVLPRTPEVEPLPQPAVVVAVRPLMTQNQPPTYPVAALRHGDEGNVLVELTIGVDGHVHQAVVIESSGYPALDRAACEQLATWAFEPARRDGVPFESTFRQPVVFHITG